MATSTPRAVFVHRETDYEQLLARHATPGQARFFLETRGQRIEDVERQHTRFHATLREARASLPENWRQAAVRRDDLDRFLFGPEDVVVVVGQDGLVANVAKYLDGQPVVGVNPAPDLYDGVLVRVPLARLTPILAASAARAADVERRTMVEAVLDTGERLLSLNEIFVGHRSHQSARYTLEVAEVTEYQSSSGSSWRPAPARPAGRARSWRRLASKWRWVRRNVPSPSSCASRSPASRPAPACASASSPALAYRSPRG